VEYFYCFLGMASARLDFGQCIKKNPAGKRIFFYRE
jgi:hypothetical protein